MSFKIYEGYRVPIFSFKEAVLVVRRQQRKAFSKMFKDKVENTITRVISIDSAVSKVGSYFRERFRLHPEEFAVGFDFWLGGDYCYIIPCGYSVAGCLPDWIEDYHYQNQVDEGDTPPEYESRMSDWLSAGYGHPEQTFSHKSIDLNSIWDFEVEALEALTAVTRAQESTQS